ncbi:MAG: hypothetical protein AB9M60_00715 [Leptothrix sp. (in: b-proteobacteria)]
MLVARIGVQAAQGFEEQAMSWLAILRDEVRFVRFPDSDELHDIRDTARKLVELLCKVDVTPALLLFSGGLPRLVEESKIAASVDSEQTDIHRWGSFLNTLENLGNLADTYAAREHQNATTQKRKKRSDSSAGTGRAMCWSFLWLRLLGGGYPDGTGTTSPAMVMLERIAKDLGAKGSPREILRQTIKAGKSAPRLDTSAWDMRNGPIQPKPSPSASEAKTPRPQKKARLAPPAPRTGSAFGNMALSLSLQPVKGKK